LSYWSKLTLTEIIHLKIYIGIFAIILAKMALQALHKTFFWHFDGNKNHLMIIFVC